MEDKTRIILTDGNFDKYVLLLTNEQLKLMKYLQNLDVFDDTVSIQHIFDMEIDFDG